MKLSEIVQANATEYPITERQYVHALGSGLHEDICDQLTSITFQASVKDGIISFSDDKATKLQLKYLEALGYEIDFIPTYRAARKVIWQAIIKENINFRFIHAYYQMLKEFNKFKG